MIIDFLELFTEKDGDAIKGSQASKYAIDFEQASPTTGYDDARPVAVITVLGDVGSDLTVSLQDSDTLDGEFTDCAGAVTLVGGTAGSQVAIPLPLRHKRYMQVYFSTGAAAAGEGAAQAAAPAEGALVKAFITSGFQDNPPFEQAPELGRNY